MSYHGLGAVRPAGCPPSSLPAGQRDPCEIEYAFDLPLVGKTSFGLPIPAMTNDALLTVQRQLPKILDQSLPVVYQKLQPYIASLMANVEFEVPRLADQVINDQLMPIVQREKEVALAEVEVLTQKVLLGLGVITAAGLGAWWLIKRKS